MSCELPVSQFNVDPDKCVACGMCVLDCVAGIISIENGIACVTPEKDQDCIGCRHCLAVCPYGAVSVTGVNPENTRAIGPFDPESLANLIRARRSVRQFTSGVVGPERVRAILDLVANAPTGVNMRERRFTVILDPKVLDDFRDRASRLLVDQSERVPEESLWLVDLGRLWLEEGIDALCRNAPHMVVMTAGPGQVCKQPDCIIALSYFELYAQANGIGTTWCGIVDGILRIFPESRRWLGIPDDHEIGYVMLFGPAGVHYHRDVARRAEDVTILSELHG